MNETAHDIAKLATELNAFSPVAIKLCDVIDDETSTGKSIADIIQQDPVLTTKLLKLANSPYYGFSQQISEIEDAFSRVGTTELFRMALSVSASETFHGIPETLITMRDFWNHSILCAHSALEIAANFNLKASGALYAAGLLHDIGQLVLFSHRKQQSIEVLERCIDSYEELDQCQVEQEVFGFTHADVGLELARMWNFPPILQACIAHHHDYENATSFQQEVLTINMANILAILTEIRSEKLNDIAPVSDNLRKQFNDNLTDIKAICERVEQSYARNKSIMLDALS